MGIRLPVFLIRIIPLFWAVMYAAPTILYAQLRVTNVVPRQNEIKVAVNDAIAVSFLEELDPATLNSETWKVHGNQTGFYQGKIVYDAATGTGFFTPSSFFKEGEVVSVTLTAGVRNNLGLALLPFQWSFTVAVEYGTGTFSEPIAISIGENERDPVAVYAADFNNDFFPDLAVANNSTNSVTIFINEFFVFGGSFQTQGIVAVGNGPNSIAGGDFDADGLLDLAVSSFDDNSLTLLRNTGGGIFSVSQNIGTAEHPTQIEAADYNNDGLMDLAAVILGVNRLQIFLNQGNGRLIPRGEIYPTGASPYGLAAGDFDGDGDLDIVVANSGDNSIIVYKNDGQAQFSHSGEVSVLDFPTVVMTHDLLGRSDREHYGDGTLDLVLVHPNINSVTVLENRSRDGGFVTAQKIDVGIRPSSIFVGDVDTTDAIARTSGLGRDHDLDLAVPNMFSENLHILTNEFNNGFVLEPEDIYAAGETPINITGADFDRDGDIDLAVTNLTANTVSILLNRGGQRGGIRFTQPTQTLDFGQVYVGSDSSRTFSIINPGGETVLLEEISTTIPQFAVSVSRAAIAPGENFQLTVTFSPTDTVAYEDSLTIRTRTFGMQSELRIGLSGEGIQAVISVVPDTLYFGDVLQPQSSTLPIHISNVGNGDLFVRDLQFSDPAFSSQVKQLTVPPHSSRRVDITFAPTAATTYFDTLAISSNDRINSEVLVILLGGPNQFPPEIISADTVMAVEDSLFQYTAIARDLDGTQPLFEFRDLPSWLRPNSFALQNNAVTGTPLEGDLDTTFVVFAKDGSFSDTLSVYIRVKPVNDPPVFKAIDNQTVTEHARLSFQLVAVDPEDSTLAYSAIGLPSGASLIKNDNKTATFVWTPEFGDRGIYEVVFVVSEVFGSNSLSDTATVRIRVEEVLPDLKVTALGTPDLDISLNQTRVITGVVGNELAPVANPFRLTFFHNGEAVSDTVLTGLGVDQEISFRYLALFDKTGLHEIVLRVDTDNQISEVDEENNSAALKLEVSKGKVVVRPNPFTPNADGFNDLAVFDFSSMVLSQPQLRLFEFNGGLLTTLEQPVDSKFWWDGRDKGGHEQKPGIYLYVLSERNKRVASGYLVLAR